MKSLRKRLVFGSLFVGLGLMHSGAAFASFEGFGADIPLEQATKMIVPGGYSVDYGMGVDASTGISWNSAPDWKKALSSAVAKEGLRAEYGSDTVMIVKSSMDASMKSSINSASRPYSSNPEAATVQKKSSPPSRIKKKSSPRVTASAQEVGGGGFVIRPYHKSRSSSSSSNGMSGKVMSGKEMSGKDGWNNYSGRGQFIVENGYMLHGTLNTWAEATGWKVVWESDHDYFIEATATFGGNFVEASSALVEAMGDARPQISVDYYNGNKVMVVSNKLSDSVNR